MRLSTTTLGYAQTQCYAIVKYLGLVFWPHPLVFDYGTAIIKEPLKIILPGLLLLGLGVAAVVGVWRRTFFGFLLCWFFAVLAPSSSVVAVVTQTMAEHRIYLSLAAVIILVVLALHRGMGRWSLALWVVVAVTFGGLTSLRNRDYRTAFSIWEDTVQKCPANARALGNLGTFSLMDGQTRKARDLSVEAIRLNPNYLEPRMNLGIILCQEGHLTEGIQQFRYAVEINPNNVKAQTNLGMALFGASQWKEAQAHFEEVLRLDPGNALVKQYLTYVKVKGAGSK